MSTVNHRFTLINPALMSAPIKKSIFWVSSQILAYNVLTSMGASFDYDFSLWRKISFAPARS
jgi:hypothetical protein